MCPLQYGGCQQTNPKSSNSSGPPPDGRSIRTAKQLCRTENAKFKALSPVPDGAAAMKKNKQSSGKCTEALDLSPGLGYTMGSGAERQRGRLDRAADQGSRGGGRGEAQKAGTSDGGTRGEAIQQWAGSSSRELVGPV